MNAPILTLDAATSSLDPQAKPWIQVSLSGLFSGNPATVITIARGLSTLRNTDRIVVLDQDRIVESGSHPA